ncbi:MAG: transglycosylase domain-containing protein [Bacilli bacterium]|nr:transglycosylase domain-containing protein [Bacilli bacterium]
MNKLKQIGSRLKSIKLNKKSDANKSNEKIQEAKIEEPKSEEIKDKKIKEKKEKVKKPKKKYKKTLILSFIAIIGILFLTMILAFALYIIISSPNFDKNLLYKKESTVLYDKDGNEFARIGSENRVLVKYEQLPQVLIDSIIATEDSRFFQHNGFDAARFLKASMGQLMGKSDAGGASTLTMQVIKNTYTNSTDHGIKGIVRKFTDIYMAVFKLESSYTKEEIIEFYVNSQWLGYDGDLNYTGIFGVEQASQYYFGKSVTDINLVEAALLAGLFQNPTYYNPYTQPERAENRRNTVLNLMVRHGYITKEEAEEAKAIKVESMLVKRDADKVNDYQAFIDYVLKDVEDNTGINPYVTPVEIYTTLDRSIQSTLTKLEKGELYSFANDTVQFGMAITSVKDGSIIAMSGGRNYKAKGLNRASDIKRQPGSTAKILFDYGPYFEFLNGSTYSMWLDESYTYSSGKKINNFDRGYKGLITTRRALVGSRNIPALKAFQAVAKDHIEDLRNFVHGLGIDYGAEGPYESASIGSFDGVSPLQMSAAYAAYGRGGYYIKPYSYTKVVDPDTEKVYEYKYTKEKVMSDSTAYMITSILVTAGNENVGGNIKISGTDVAAKGGTTTVDANKRKEIGLPDTVTPDHWNITYTPSYSIALWYGYDKLTKERYLTSTNGGKARRGIMAAVAKKVYGKNEKFKKPSSVVSAKVELQTFPAQSPSACTPSELVGTELFKKGTEPSETSSRFAQLDKPTNVSASVSGQTVTIKWNAIKTPDAINTTYLQDHFNKYYDNHASSYYEKRIAYNETTFGDLGYVVSIKNSDGSDTALGFTTSTSYTYTTSGQQSDYTFIVKTAYNKFRCNMSAGAEVSASVTPLQPDPTETTQPDQNNNQNNTN